MAKASARVIELVETFDHNILEKYITIKGISECIL